MKEEMNVDMDRLAKTFTRIRMCKPEDVPILEKVTKADDHALILPTHVVERDSQMIGYLSVANIPTVVVWMDSVRANIRDSIAAMNFWENSISDRGGPAVIIPCNSNSPFRPYIEQVGYRDMKVGLFIKPL